jgi:hypothetical protein
MERSWLCQGLWQPESKDDGNLRSSESVGEQRKRTEPVSLPVSTLVARCSDDDEDDDARKPAARKRQRRDILYMNTKKRRGDKTATNRSD